MRKTEEKSTVVNVGGKIVSLLTMRVKGGEVWAEEGKEAEEHAEGEKKVGRKKTRPSKGKYTLPIKSQDPDQLR